MIRLLLTILSIFITILSFGQARTWTTSTYGNGSQQAWKYTPPGYDPDRPEGYALVIFLHGQGEWGTTINNVKNTGLAEQIDDGMDLDAVVICPQLQTNGTSGSGAWGTTTVNLVYDYMLSNYNIDVNKVYITGLSLGGSGSAVYARTYPYKIAAFIPCSGSNYSTSSAEADSLAKVPVYMIHGYQDGTQDASNAYNLTNALQARNPTVLPMLETFWAKGHNASLWDTELYEKFDTKFFPWLSLHDKRPDSTAKYYVDSTARATNDSAKMVMYWKSVRVVNSLGASSHKTALLSQLNSIKTELFGNGYRRWLLDLAVSGKGSISGVNVLTNGNTNQTYSSLVDEDNETTEIGFTVVTRTINGTEEVAIGDEVELFAGVPASLYEDSWDVFDVPNSGRWRLTGLDDEKKYTIVLYGSASGASVSYSYQTGLTATVGGTTIAQGNQIKNTTRFHYFPEVSPSSGQIDIELEATYNDCHGYVGFIEVIEHGTQEEGENQLPIVSAGNNQSIRLPENEVTLSGSASDVDGTITGVLWTKVSGPDTYTITDDDALETTVTGLVEGMYVFRLYAYDEDEGESYDDIQITVLPAYHSAPSVTAEDVTKTGVWANLKSSHSEVEKIEWSVLKKPGQGTMRVTFVGSSTTEGYGVSSTQNYVHLFKEHFKSLGIIDTAYKRGAGGTSIFDMNVATTLEYMDARNSDILVINYPSNAFDGSTYSISEIMEEFQVCYDSAVAAGKIVFITTTQPRDAFTSGSREKLEALRDSIMNRFQDHAIDFWTCLVGDDRKLKSELALGDGIHINPNGHELLFQKVRAANIFGVTGVRFFSGDETNTAVSGLTTSGEYIFQISVTDSEGYSNSDESYVTITVPECSGDRKNFSFTGYKHLSDIMPGDTLVVSSGNYGFTEIDSIFGTESCPIVIINDGGQVYAEALNIGFPAEHVKVLGIGHEGTDYGFRFGESNYFGMHLKAQGPVEVGNVHIQDCQMGIQIKYGDVFPTGLIEHVNYVLHNIKIEDIRGESGTAGNEGIYVGSSTTPTYPKIKGLHIYDVLIENTGREGLQISNAQDVLVERVKIINPSLSNEGSQNHAFNMGHDVEGTAKNMYIQSSPAYNVFLSGGRITFECSTIEYIEREGIERTLAIWGKNFEFDAQTWVEPYQQFIIKNILLIDAGGVNIESDESEGPLMANEITNIKLQGDNAVSPYVWGPDEPAPIVNNVGAEVTFSEGCTPPTLSTVWHAKWPAVSPGEEPEEPIIRKYFTIPGGVKKVKFVKQ